jgi:hypothetical protein
MDEQGVISADPATPLDQRNDRRAIQKAYEKILLAEDG